MNNDKVDNKVHNNNNGDTMTERIPSVTAAPDTRLDGVYFEQRFYSRAEAFGVINVFTRSLGAINQARPNPNYNVGRISDGYHTFDELYEHRIVLFIALCKSICTNAIGNTPTWMSKLHSEGSSLDGWFIAGINEGPGKQITYHLPMSYWDEMLNWCVVLDKAPKYDGHTPADVLKRLKEL